MFVGRLETRRTHVGLCFDWCFFNAQASAKVESRRKKSHQEKGGNSEHTLKRAATCGPFIALIAPPSTCFLSINLLLIGHDQVMIIMFPTDDISLNKHTKQPSSDVACIPRDTTLGILTRLQELSLSSLSLVFSNVGLLSRISPGFFFFISPNEKEISQQYKTLSADKKSNISAAGSNTSQKPERKNNLPQNQMPSRPRSTKVDVVREIVNRVDASVKRSQTWHIDREKRNRPIPVCR